MVWVSDEGKISQPEREKLLKKRETLVNEIKMLQGQQTFRSKAAEQFHLEDLRAKAKQVLSIDKKLGRV